MIAAALFAGLVACGGSSSEGGPRGPGAAGPGRPGAGPGGPGSPPELVIPVDEPSWRGLSGLLDDPHAYGEASWDDVRMRVAGHLAVAGRDRARLRAAAGDWAGCAAAYTDNAAALAALRLSGATGPPIRAALAAAATRDAALCDALATGRPPTPGPGTVAPLRARWVALVVRARAGEDVRADAEALAADARGVAAPAALELEDFADFEARHRLRVALVEAWADAVSPFVATEPFGYWRAEQVPRMAAGVAAAAAELARGAAPVPAAADRVAAEPRSPWSAAELGSLVTGDSTIDTLGFAGPAAIGTLARLGADDPEHAPWLAEVAAELEAAPPAEVPERVARRVAELEAFPGGIRYYAIKQLKNTAVRQLARQGAYAEARTIVATSWPLHAQDWACPDREAILTLMLGRLELLAGAPEAEATNAHAHELITRFLVHVAEAEAHPKPRPPRGPGGPPPPGR